ncbi:MAG: hypothetical protein M3N53_10200 [Actinomycetota bacterium]|nr:hypothetical protein [Actinomycetota bacterium]
MKRILAGAVAVAAAIAAALPAASSPVDVQYVCFDRVATIEGAGPDGVVRGTERADVIVTFGRDDIVLGRGGNDRICTGSGADYVSGGTGHDLVDLGRGDDLAYGGDGLNYLNGSGGEDRLNGAYGAADTLVGAAGEDVLRAGDDGGDYLFGGRDADKLQGGHGSFDSDLLLGGEGADMLDGGSGSDTVSFNFEDAAVQVDLSRQAVAPVSTGDTLRGIENVWGSIFDDAITGDALGNRVRGDDGSDAIAGGAGQDHLDGGTGGDTVDGGEGVDVISFLDSPLGVTVDIQAGTATGAGSDSVTGFEHVAGSAHDDEIYGDAASNRIFGGRGANVVLAFGGDDFIDQAGGGDAGEGSDECFDAGGVENCEVHIHGDPAAFTTITSPLHAATLAVSELREIVGTVSSGAFGPRPQRVEVALRRMRGSGCSWFDFRQQRMQPWHCERPIWGEARLDEQDGTWTRRIPRPTQLLSAGRYEVRARIAQPGYTEDLRFTYNVVEFRLR